MEFVMKEDILKEKGKKKKKQKHTADINRETERKQTTFLLRLN